MATDPERTQLPADLPKSSQEVFENLGRIGNVRIERIVTPPQADPGPAYDQAHDEWVLILQGWAELRVETTTHRLQVGDACLLPARTQHQVMRTCPDETTVWLALHAPQKTDTP